MSQEDLVDVTKLGIGRKAALIAISGAALLILLGGPALGLDRELAEDTSPQVPLTAIREHASTATQPAALRVHETADTREAASHEAALGATPTPAAPATPEQDRQAAIEVPDFSRMRIDRVIRRSRELGLRIAARDDYGSRIPVGEARYYRVRPGAQSIAPGTRVDTGSRISLRAYALSEFGPRFATGY